MTMQYVHVGVLENPDISWISQALTISVEGCVCLLTVKK